MNYTLNVREYNDYNDLLMINQELIKDATNNFLYYVKEHKINEILLLKINMLEKGIKRLKKEKKNKKLLQINMNY